MNIVVSEFLIRRLEFDDLWNFNFYVAQPAGAVEYTDCTSVEG